MPAPRYDTISFLSDYGTRDEFVGLVKGVIRDLAPHVAVVDLTHEIDPFDVRAASLTLARCISYVPSGVVLAVVDPGVGTSRQALAVEVAGGAGVIVGPDNGLLAPAVAIAGGAERVVALTNRDLQLEAPGATFAGRDVFAPAAAHLCNGVDLAELGELLDADLLMPGVVPLPRTEAGELHCEVLWVDRFGNCQLNVGPDDLEGWDDMVRIGVGDGTTSRIARRTTTFADISGGSLGLLLDSYGMLALAMDRRSAALELGLVAGAPVVLRSLGDPVPDAVPEVRTSPIAFRTRST